MSYVYKFTSIYLHGCCESVDERLNGLTYSWYFIHSLKGNMYNLLFIRVRVLVLLPNKNVRYCIQIMVRWNKLIYQNTVLTTF